MKIIINENERGFLFKNGTYRRLLMPNKYLVKSFLGETYARVDVSKAISVPNVDIAVLFRDKDFADKVARVDVPDGFIAIHREDKRIVGILQPGTYCFWNCYREHSFTLVDISKGEITDLTPEQLMVVPRNLYGKVDVSEGEIGLLYFDGKLERTLESGSYYFWNSMRKISCQMVDLRTQQLDIAGQEILTADKVSLRINFVCTYKITDAIKVTGEIKDYKTQIYTLTQLALREYVGRFRFDELLEQKDSIAAFVLKQLQEKQDTLFVAFSDAGLKDIILPGEIRDIMNTVLVAEKNAQANVIARREEVASTRSLLNTAKLMEENGTLYKLKELEYLEKICDKVGNISVGGGNLLTELRGILSGKSEY
jgi:regulator of protease activity HflC (stomatin/prohibitin superfamily)